MLKYVTLKAQELLELDRVLLAIQAKLDFVAFDTQWGVKVYQEWRSDQKIFS